MKDGLTRRELLAAGGAAALALAGAKALAKPLSPPAAVPKPVPSRPVTTKMATRPIPRSGEALPCIGLGTWQSFDILPKHDASRRAVLEALFEAGGSVIDSSPMYGRSEATVGRLLTAMGAKDKPFRASKVWTSGKDAGVRQMARSLTRMTVSEARPFALMQVHNLLDTEVHLPTLKAWKAEGRIRYIGVTHYMSSSFPELERWITKERLDVIQLPYSIAYRHAEKRLLDAAKDTGTAVLVNRPFDAGELFRLVRGRSLPSWAAEIGAASWAQVFLKWLLAHPAVTCPIPGTSKAKHMRDNAAAGVGPLPDAKLRERIAREVLG